jgi:hypothetical protein
MFSNLQVGTGKTYEVVKFSDENLLLYGMQEIPPPTDEARVLDLPKDANSKKEELKPQLSLGIPDPAISRPFTVELTTPGPSADTTSQSPAASEPKDETKRKKKVDAPPIDVAAPVEALSSELETLIAPLARNAQNFMRVVLEDWRDNRAAKLVIKDKDTFGLSDTLITKYGLRDGSAVSRELAEAGWLQLGAQSQRFLNRKIAGVDTDCMILSSDIASKLSAAFALNPSGPIEIGESDEGY